MMAQSGAKESRRTTVKKFYTVKALNVLTNSPDEGKEFSFIIGPEKLRTEILAELGQLHSPARILEAATYICQEKLRVKDAVVFVRRWRNGGASPGDSDALGSEIVRLIQNYSLRHPQTTFDQIRDALEIAGEGYPRESWADDDPYDHACAEEEECHAEQTRRAN